MKQLHHAWVAILCCHLATPYFGAAQCTLACNNLVHVSIPSAGFAVILPEMVLDGDQTSCPGTKIANVFSPAGTPIGDTVTCALVGEILNVTISHPASGNACWGTIQVLDELAPAIACADLVVGCTDDTDPVTVGVPVVTDNCDAVPTLVFSEISTILPCNNPFSSKILRTWHATDASGNVAVPCTQVISVARPLLSQVVFPPDHDGVQAPALPCGAPNTNPSATGQPTINGQPIGSLCKMTVEYNDLALQNCPGSNSIIRSWTVLDCCSGQILEDNQILVVADQLPPALTCSDSLVFNANNGNCTGSFLLPPMAATDNCSYSITWQTLVPGIGTLSANGGAVSNMPVGTHTVTYRASDGCGNVGTCEVALVVKDATAPIASCGENTSVSLNAQGTANVSAAVFNDGSYDACCPNSTLVFSVKRMDGSSGPFFPTVVFDCGDAGEMVTVILQVADCHGNTNTCMVDVLVQDKTAPTLVCPPNTTLRCDNPLPLPLPVAGQPQASDACGLDTLFFSDVETLNQCHTGTVVRTFTAVDHGGFTKTCTQTITLVDTTSFQFFFPPDTVVGCVAPIPDLPVGDAVAVGDCEFFALNISDEVIPLPCGLKIFRTYSFIEWCSGVDTSYTQFIKVVDNAPPVWDIPQGSLDRVFLCEGDVVKPPPPTATDYCTPAIVDVVSDVITPGDCPHHYTRVLTYGAVDTCGNVAANFPIHITVFDTVPPYADELPDLGPVNCYADRPAPNIADVTGESDNCFGAVTVAFVGDSLDPGCTGTVVRTYRLTDVCGNDTLITQQILLGGSVVVDDTLTVAGQVFVEGQLPVPGVEVHLFDNAGAAMDSTDANGGFAFGNVGQGMSCTLQPQKNDGLLNGVTTFDMVLLTRHILGSQLLASPYKIIAADVNNSGSVTTFDIVAMRKAILGVETSFPNNTSWRFVAADFVFEEPEDPFANPFPETLFLSNIGSDLLGRNFVAVKIGDLNGSANLVGSADNETGTEQEWGVPLSTEGILPMPSKRK